MTEQRKWFSDWILLLILTLSAMLLLVVFDRLTESSFHTVSNEFRQKHLDKLLADASCERPVIWRKGQDFDQASTTATQINYVDVGWCGEQPVAAVVTAVAKQGYVGPIELFIVIDPANQLLAVRPGTHRETQSIGALLGTDVSWQAQWQRLSFDKLPPNQWRLRQDGGGLDAISGATVTSRAVVATVLDVLLTINQNHDND